MFTVNQEPFALTVFVLERHRCLPREFHDTVIQQRHARFQRYGHGGPIDLCEDVIW
jgi:hypothetical protein